MPQKRWMLFLGLFVSAALALETGCNRKSSDGPEKETKDARSAETAFLSGAVQVRLGAVEEPRVFDVKLIQLKPGTEVSLTVENRLKSDSLNWVLTRAGKEADLLKNRENPASELLLASTDRIAPGASGEVKFTVPSEPGDYPFLSTVRGTENLRGIIQVRK